MIRLGQRYSVLQIRDTAIAWLRYEYPDSVEKWAKVSHKFTYVDFYPGVVLDIFNLAREQHLQSFLPGLYLAMAKNLTMVSVVCETTADLTKLCFQGGNYSIESGRRRKGYLFQGASVVQ